MNCKLVTIIPYYQRKSGILAKAIRSALDQTGIADFNIIVVDDVSPIPAIEELSCFSARERARIQIIKQKKNSGPGAARNRALDSLSRDVDYVAFLDSDDAWTTTHLSTSIAALQREYDFYFADHFQLNQIISAFNRAKRLDLENHKLIDDNLKLYEYVGDMFNQTLTGNIIGTSTVVYRFPKFPELRFREEYRNAGEDYLFWLEISALTKKFVFSTACECRYGEGVNVYSGAAWGTTECLRRIHDEIKYRKSVDELFQLSGGQTEQNKMKLKELRTQFVQNLIHSLIRGSVSFNGLILNQIQTDPAVLGYFVPVVFNALLRWKNKENVH